MPPETSIVGNQLDPQAVNLAKAIRSVETNGNFSAQGKSGEYGAYQWTPDAWSLMSKNAGVNVELNQATPEQQNEVAYKQVKQWKDQGYNPGQIASMWNSGNPNAYQDPSFRGVNKYGAKFDVPVYAQKVAQTYQQLKSSQPTGTPSPSPSTTSQEPGFFQNIASGNLGAAGKQALDFAFPIVSDVGDIISGKSTKTPLQVLGDLGLSVLWFIPGIGGGLGGAIKGAGILGETGSRIAGHALGGAIGGYGADVASKLAGGQTDMGEVLTPGVGTVTGGVLGGALGKLGSKYSEAGVLGKVTDTNNAILGQTKRGATDLAEAFSKDKNIGELLAQKKVNLASLYNPDTLAFDTLDTANGLRQSASTLNSTLSDALRKVPGLQNLTEIQSTIDNKLASTYADKVTAGEAQQIAQNEFEKIVQQYGNNLDASTMNALKQRFWNLSHFDSTTSNLTRNTYRQMGNTFKTLVEDMGKSAGLSDIANYNNYLGAHLDAADMLQRLNGTKVKGGRLGDLLQKHTLGLIGAGAGGMLGGGLPGAIAGGVTAEYASGKISNVLRNIASSPVKSAILKRITEQDPEVVQKIVAYANQNPTELQPIVEQLKKMGVDIFKPIEGAVAPVATPSASSQGLLQRLLQATTVRGVQAQPQIQGGQ